MCTAFNSKQKKCKLRHVNDKWLLTIKLLLSWSHTTRKLDIKDQFNSIPIINFEFCQTLNKPAQA